MTNMTTLTLTTEISARTSAGEALFFIPGTTVALKADEELAGHWVTLPEGTKVDLCAVYHKTDTYMCAVTFPAHDDEETGEWMPAITNGIVFRRKTWEKLVASVVDVEAA